MEFAKFLSIKSVKITAFVTNQMYVLCSNVHIVVKPHCYCMYWLFLSPYLTIPSMVFIPACSQVSMLCLPSLGKCTATKAEEIKDKWLGHTGTQRERIYGYLVKSRVHLLPKYRKRTSYSEPACSKSPDLLNVVQKTNNTVIATGPFQLSSFKQNSITKIQWAKLAYDEEIFSSCPYRTIT